MHTYTVMWEEDGYGIVHLATVEAHNRTEALASGRYGVSAVVMEVA